MLFWRESGYFAAANEFKPLLHTWSLAVEEQFYLVFPWLLLLCRRFGRRSLEVAVAAILLLSLAVAHVGGAIRPEASFFLLPSRFWEPLAGVAVTLALARLAGRALAGWLRNLLSGAGLLLVFGSIALLPATVPTPSLWTLLPVLGTALFLAFSDARTWAGRLLSHPLAVRAGLLSYGAYLWHQPLFAFARHGLGRVPTPLELAGLVVATFALAEATYRWVETPFRTPRFSRRAIFGGWLAGSLLMIAIGAAAVYSRGLDAQFRARLGPEESRILAVVEANTGRQAERRVLPYLDECRRLATKVDAELESALETCAGARGPVTLVIGDSQALGLGWGVAAASPGRAVFTLANGGCTPFESVWECPTHDIPGLVERRAAAIGEVIFVGAGFRYFASPSGGFGRREMFERHKVDPLLLHDEAIRTTLAYLQRMTPHVPVVWLGPSFEPHLDLQHLRTVLSGPLQASPGIRANFLRLDREFAARAASVPNLAYVSFIERFETPEPLQLLDGDCLYYRDGDHLSPCALERLSPRIRAIADEESDRLRALVPPR
jgi:hypothetical protein